MNKHCLIKYGCFLASMPTVFSPLWAGVATPNGWTIDEDNNYTLDTESNYSHPLSLGNTSSLTITENGNWLYGTEEAPAMGDYNRPSFAALLGYTGGEVHISNEVSDITLNGDATIYTVNNNATIFAGALSPLELNIGSEADINIHSASRINVALFSMGQISAQNISGNINFFSAYDESVVAGIIAAEFDIENFNGSLTINRVSTKDFLETGFSANAAISAEANADNPELENVLGDIDIATLSGTVAFRTDNNATDEDVLATTNEGEKGSNPQNGFTATQSTIYGGDVTIGTLSGTVTSDVEATGTFDYVEIEAASIWSETSITIDNLTGTIATTVDVDNDTTSSDSTASISVYGLKAETPTPVDYLLVSEETEAETASITINAFGEDASISAILNVGDLTTSNPNLAIEVAAINSYDVTISDVNGTVAAAINGNSIEISSTLHSYDYQICSNAISAENNISLGNINGNITSVIDMGSISNIANTGTQTTAIYSNNGDITVGNIAENAYITSITDIGSTLITGNHSDQINSSYAFYSDYDITIGDVAGIISASTNIDTGISNYIHAYAYTIEGEGISIGDVTGTISSTANISEVSGNSYMNTRSYAKAISGMETTLGDVSGNILATATIGDLTNENEDAYALSRSYAIYSEIVTIDTISGTIAATATTGNISTEGNNARNASYACGITSYSSTEMQGTEEGSNISAVATTGNITYTGEEELSSYTYDGQAYAYALSAGSGSLGTLNGNINATATVGSGHNYTDASATGIISSGFGGKFSALKASSKNRKISASGILKIDAINGNITVLADTSASNNTDLSRVSATGISIGASTTTSDSENTENYIGSISGIIDVTSKVGNYYGFNGFVNTMGISTSSSSGSIAKDRASKLISFGEDESNTVALDLHIGTLDGSINVTTEIGNGTGVTPFQTIGIQGFTGTDEYAHDLIIDTLSGNVTVNSTIGFTTFEMTEGDLRLVNRLLSYDYLPLNVVAGITDRDFNTEAILYDFSYDLKDSEINIGDLSGSITVNATSLAVDFSDYVATYLENGAEAPNLHQVYTEVAGITTDHSDVNIADFSGDITVTVTTPELEEGLEVQNGTVIVSGITAMDSNVNIEDFTGNITVRGTIEGEGTVVATGISASEISGNYAGNISVSSDDYAIGMILRNESVADEPQQLLKVTDQPEQEEAPLASSEFTIDGDISAIGAEGKTYAIYAGYFDYEEVTSEKETINKNEAPTPEPTKKELVLVAGESNEIINITTNASITGAIDLTGGDDTINLVNCNTVDTEGTFDTDIYNVEALNVLSGTWTFDNDYDYNTVNIDGGTLTYAVDADVNGITLTSGVLETTEGTLTNVGTLSAGTFRVSGTGDWADLTLNGATLDLQRSYELSSDTITYTSGTILLNGAETVTYNWGFSTITSGQTVTLNNGLFMSSTDITVDGGNFVFNGGNIDLNSHSYDLGDFTVPEGGTVYGIGTIVGDVTNNGTIRPGYSPGTINITGNFVQSETGTLVMEIRGNDYDVINIRGNAEINGTLDLTTEELENNVEYTLIASTDEVQGEFNNIVVQATRDAEVTYDPTHIYVELTHINYTEFAENVGEYTVGETLDQVFEIAANDSLLGELIAKVDDFMDSSDVTEFLSQLAAPMSMNTGWLVEQNSDVMNLIKDQQAQTPAGSYVWAKAIHENMDFQSYENYSKRDGDYNGAVAGFSMQAGQNWSLGAAISGVDGSLDNAAQSKYDNETTSVWLLATHYMASESNGWNQALRFGLGYSDVDVDAYDRFIFNGDHINSSYKGESYSGFAEYAMNKQFGSWKIEPSVGVTYQRHTDDAHNDMLNGEILRTWDDVTSKSIKGTLGCRAMYVIEMPAAKLIPFANIRLEYQFEDQPEGNFTWGGTSISGTLESAEWDEQTLRLGAGLMYSLDNGWSTSVSGDYLEGDSHDAYGVNAGFSYSF